ncbi:MAG: LysR family transcriptional regulator [Roseovarius sp.]
MLDQLRQIAIFAKTVDHGSFRGAARALNLSPSVVSHHISQLEEQLGTALLYRSTRKLALTRDGARLLDAARTMVDAAEAGIQDVADSARVASGELRVTLPAILAQSHIVERIARFSQEHENVHLSLDFTDARRELIGDGFDVAIRMGWLKDSTLMSKKLQDVPRRLVASKDYLSTRPTPRSPRDLQSWDWIVLSQVMNHGSVFRARGDKPISIKPNAHILVNDAHALYRFAQAGAGLAIIPDFLAQADVSGGEMSFVLPDWSVDPVSVYAVWPANAPKHGLSKLFINAIS